MLSHMYDEKTGLVVVDVQNDFADPRGSLYVTGGEEVVLAVNAETHKAREAGSPVVYTQDWHPESTPHFQKDGGIWPVHCVAGTWGADFHPELVVEGSAVKKGSGGEDGYSGFSMRDPETGKTTSTGLAKLLRELGVQAVVVVGLALDYCVKETAIDARREGFATLVLRQATAPVDLQEGDGERAAQEIAAAGAEVR
ncbi:MAG: isochorismatase family protein [Acidimicrobiia bacterium]